MKVLVLGGSGILGREMLKVIPGSIGTYHSRPFKNGIPYNIEIFKDLVPDVCINCVVERTVDVCENNWNQTKSLNINLVDEISRECQNYGIHLVHISTDYVFDGRSPPYFPESIPNPLQNYGISKLISELRVKHVSKHTIVRVPVLYSVAALNESAVTLIGKKVIEQTKLATEDCDFPRRPVFIPDLCLFLRDIIQNRTFGTLHFWNPESPKTKYEIGKMIADYLHISYNHVRPTASKADASRPYDTQLLDIHQPKYVTPLIEGIKLCFEKLWHPELKGYTPDVLLLLDLDGTLVDSERAHYESYLPFLPNLKWEDFVKGDFFPTEEIRKLKFEKLKHKNIDMMSGANEFIEWIDMYNIPHVVVTNTNQKTVDLFKSKLEPLRKLKNWVVREHYKNPKPDPEPYRLALELFSRGEKFIIGVENSVQGWLSLREVTTRIYMIGNPELPKEADVYTISNLTSILSQDTVRSSN
jgi:dTDP-4-dehydrorhamnose reductase/beta-phosphoglucomutase-like phosphatase (HAD superfamily)